MGLGELPTIGDYWNLAGDGIVFMEIPHNMSLNRWEDLKRYFKISNPRTDQDSKGANWYTKLEPLLAHFRAACLHYYQAGRNISIDKQLLLFKGRSKHTMNIPAK